LFICPVVLGSGVKIKVVEALSYGMPVALSEPSRAGVEFATAAVGFDREHPDVIAQVIASLLSDPPRLQRMSDEIVRSYDEALAARSPMAKMLSELLLSAPTK
jgi:glycosyltransferase involved in cell wall biosynthesis